MLNYDNHPPTNRFLDSLSSYYFLLDIGQCAKVKSNYKASINNIFPNMDLSSLTASISDHLLQVLVTPKIFPVFITQSQRNVEQTGRGLIKKTLFLVTYWLLEMLLVSNINTYKRTFLWKVWICLTLMHL